MNSLNYFKKVKDAGVIAIISSVFLGIPLISSPTSAQTIIAPLCPGLYYEEPWNDVLEPPVGCPANERTIYEEQAEMNDPDYNTPNYGVVPPLPEVVNDPVAYIDPTAEGTVDILLDNDTDALVSYQVLGHTGERYLQGGEEIILKDVPTPVTVTMIREDNGLLEFMTTGSSSDYLHVTLDEDRTFDDIQGVLRVQPSGEVFLQ
jgi:hypothetical protein